MRFQSFSRKSFFPLIYIVLTLFTFLLHSGSALHLIDVLLFKTTKLDQQKDGACTKEQILKIEAVFVEDMPAIVGAAAEIVKGMDDLARTSLTIRQNLQVWFNIRTPPQDEATLKIVKSQYYLRLARCRYLAH